MRELVENSGIYAAYEAVLKAASSIEAFKSSKVQDSLKTCKPGEYDNKTAQKIAENTPWAPSLKNINGATFVVLLSNLSLHNLPDIELNTNLTKLHLATTKLLQDDQSPKAQSIRTTLHRLISAKWDNPKFNYEKASKDEVLLHLYANSLKHILVAWSAVCKTLQEKAITASSVDKSIKFINTACNEIKSYEKYLPEAFIETLVSLLEKDKEILKNTQDTTPPENRVFSPASLSPSLVKTAEEIRQGYYNALGFFKTIPTTPPSPNGSGPSPFARAFANQPTSPSQEGAAASENPLLSLHLTGAGE